MKTSFAKRNGTRLAALVVVLLGLAAHDSFAAGHPRVHQVNRRYENQQDRIAKGVANGSLTARETARLENREAALKSQERSDRAQNGGHLTRAEQAHLNRRENRLSRSIYNQKHDAQTQPH